MLESLLQNWKNPVRVKADLIAAGIPSKMRPEEWWYLSAGHSPCPFIVYIESAQEGHRGGLRARYWYVWYIGGYMEIKEQVLWSGERTL